MEHSRHVRSIRTLVARCFSAHTRLIELAITLQATPENPIVGDLRLDARSLVFTSVLADEVAQRFRVRLNFWRGEWFLNLEAGTPYLEAIFEKGVPDSQARSVFAQLLLGTEGVASVDSMELERDAEHRILDLRFVARLKDGTTFRSKSYGPFVIDLGKAAG